MQQFHVENYFCIIRSEPAASSASSAHLTEAAVSHLVQTEVEKGEAREPARDMSAVPGSLSSTRHALPGALPVPTSRQAVGVSP